MSRKTNYSCDVCGASDLAFNHEHPPLEWEEIVLQVGSGTARRKLFFYDVCSNCMPKQDVAEITTEEAKPLFLGLFSAWRRSQTK